MTAELIRARVEAVHTAGVETFVLPDGAQHTSAIRKRARQRPVAVGRLGFEGDAQCNPAHGGPDRAVHVFGTEHYAVFEARAGRSLPRPVVGENLTVTGYPDIAAHVGDVVRVGTALLQVTMPTERCGYPGRNAGLPQLLKWMIETLRTGFYLRVIEPGEIGPGDVCALEERPNPHWTIEALSRAMYHEVKDPARVAEIEAVPEVAPEWKTRLQVLHARTRG